jgi:hypothetical protein
MTEFMSNLKAVFIQKIAVGNTKAAMPNKPII